MFQSLSRFEKIGIVVFGSSFVLGGMQVEVWNQYLDNGICIRYYFEYEVWVVLLNILEEEVLEWLFLFDKCYQWLDWFVLLVMFVVKCVVESVFWGNEKIVGLCLGFLRGVIGVWEVYFEQFCF